MEKIKQVLINRKLRTEKGIGMYIAALIASIAYGMWTDFTFWPTFFYIFSSVSLIVSVFEYKQIKQIQKTYKKVEERWKLKIIDEEQAIQELTTGNTKQ